MNTTNSQILNKDILISLIGDDAELAKQFEIEFLSQAQTSLVNIKNLYLQGKYIDIKEEAHFLKTSARAVGAEQCAHYLQCLEDVSLTQKKIECKHLIKELIVSVKQVHHEVVNAQ